MSHATKVVRDAVHGDMEFTAAEMRVIDTRAFQRLRGIKQLGTAYLVYPSATHTRFEHSLGTCSLTKRILGQAGGAALSTDEIEAIALAALVHDITHIPFGHTFEDERRIFPRHDESESRLRHCLERTDLAKALAEVGFREAVLDILDPAGGNPLGREVVGGAISADLLDYLKRDAWACGLAQDYDPRIYRYLRLTETQLIVELHRGSLFRPDAMSELVNLLRLRYNLTERVYYHHSKTVSGAMLSKALEAALSAERLAAEDLLDWRDDQLLSELERRAGDLPAVQALLEDFRSRQLYKRVYLQTIDPAVQGAMPELRQRDFERRFHLNEDGQRERAETAIESELGLPSGSVIVYCPASNMQAKEPEVMVSLGDDLVGPLSALGNEEVNVLLHKHRALWRFYVCLRRRYSDHFARAGEVCAELFQQPNLLPARMVGK